MSEALADQLARLCCAETEGKFFDCVTDNIGTIIAALRSHDALVKALDEIFEVGDGWGPHSAAQPSGTTGEGHAKCREIARAALNGVVGGPGQ